MGTPLKVFSQIADILDMRSQRRSGKTSGWVGSYDAPTQPVGMWWRTQRILLHFNLICAVLLTASVGMGVSGCALIQSPYIERHTVSDLTVVFLDEQSLQAEWSALTGKESLQFMPMRGGMIALKSVQGFYDFNTKTLYCQKWNYEVCGHELHHAVLGHFHDSAL